MGLYVPCTTTELINFLLNYVVSDAATQAEEKPGAKTCCLTVVCLNYLTHLNRGRLTLIRWECYGVLAAFHHLTFIHIYTDSFSLAMYL